MNKKQPKTTAKTKQAIKDAFWELYKQKKIEKITVKDITMRAGYNRSTFYAYFTDVYDVLEQIEEDLMPGVEHLPPVGVAAEHQTDLINNLILIYEKHSEYYSVLLSEKGDPGFAIKMKNVFKSMMVESVKDQTAIPMEELDYALEFLVSATISVIKHWFQQDKNMPKERLMPLMYKLMNNKFVQDLGIGWR